MPATDVIIVGSGPAGLHAAIELQRRHGLSPVVLERDPEPGGVPRWCNHRTFVCRVKKRLFRGPDYVRAWLAEAHSARVPILTETTVLRLDSDRPRVEVTSPQGPYALDGHAVLLATGAREAHRHNRLIPGDRARGVFTTAAVFQCVYLNGILPGRRFVVFGSEDISYSCVNVLRKHGGTVVAVVEPAAAARSWSSVRWYFERIRKVPHFFSVADFEIHGRGAVERVTFRSCQSDVTLDCDAVVFTGGFMPNAELVRMSSIEFNFASRGPGINQCLQTSKPWIFAAGNCLRGVVSADEAAFEGRMAARYLAGFLQQGEATGGEVRLTVDAQLAYCCPDRLLMGAQGMSHIALWASRHVREADLIAEQQQRVIWRRRFRRIQPGRRLFVPIRDLPLQSTQPIRFSLQIDRSS